MAAETRFLRYYRIALKIWIVVRVFIPRQILWGCCIEFNFAIRWIMFWLFSWYFRFSNFILQAAKLFSCSWNYFFDIRIMFWYFKSCLCHFVLHFQFSSYILQAFQLCSGVYSINVQRMEWCLATGKILGTLGWANNNPSIFVGTAGDGPAYVKFCRLDRWFLQLNCSKQSSNRRSIFCLVPFYRTMLTVKGWIIPIIDTALNW